LIFAARLGWIMRSVVEALTWIAESATTPSQAVFETADEVV
jgi:hypothetical protein